MGPVPLQATSSRTGAPCASTEVEAGVKVWGFNDWDGDGTNWRGIWMIWYRYVDVYIHYTSLYSYRLEHTVSTCNSKHSFPRKWSSNGKVSNIDINLLEDRYKINQNDQIWGCASRLRTRIIIQSWLLGLGDYCNRLSFSRWHTNILLKSCPANSIMARDS